MDLIDQLHKSAKGLRMPIESATVHNGQLILMPTTMFLVRKHFPMMVFQLLTRPSNLVFCQCLFFLWPDITRGCSLPEGWRRLAPRAMGRNSWLNSGRHGCPPQMAGRLITRIPPPHPQPQAALGEPPPELGRPRLSLIHI